MLSELSSLDLSAVAAERGHLAGKRVVIHVKVDPADRFLAHRTLCL